MLTITGLQLNLENGGIDLDEDGEPVSRARFEAFLQLIDSLKREHGLAFVLQQEARYYDRDEHALLNEAAERTGLAGYLAPALRAEQIGDAGHHTAVWIDPYQIDVQGFRAHGGGHWWHSAAELRCAAAGHRLSLISAHLHVASAPARMIEAAALAVMTQRRSAVIGMDANSARAHGRDQNLQMPDPFHRVCRSAHPVPPGEPAILDRGAAQYLTATGLISVHEHIGTPEATAFTAGHRPNQQQREGGGSQPDHVYVTPDLADGTTATITDCVVLTKQHWPDAETASDHLGTLMTLRLNPTRPGGGRDAQ